MSFKNSFLILCVRCVVHVGVRTCACGSPRSVSRVFSTALCPLPLEQGLLLSLKLSWRVSDSPRIFPSQPPTALGIHSRMHNHPRFLCGGAEDLNLDPQASAASTLTHQAISPVHEYFPRNTTVESPGEEKHLLNCMAPLPQKNDYLRYGNGMVSDNQQGPVGSSFLNTITTLLHHITDNRCKTYIPLTTPSYWI